MTKKINLSESAFEENMDSFKNNLHSIKQKMHDLAIFYHEYIISTLNTITQKDNASI